MIWELLGNPKGKVGPVTGFLLFMPSETPAHEMLPHLFSVCLSPPVNPIEETPS